MGKEGALWLGWCIKENIEREQEQAFVKTKCENNKTYIIRRYGNNYGRYIEVTECGRGGSRGRMVILEGQKKSGWRGFIMELTVLLTPEQRHTQGVNQVRGVEKIERLKTTTPVIGTSRSDPESYVGAMVGGSERQKAVLSKPSIFLMELPKKMLPVNQEILIDMPKILVQSKQRFPLRFFPFLAPVVDNFVRTGLTISLNEQGQRRVS